VDYKKVRKIVKKKTKMITLRINPELLRLFDEALEKDKEHDSRNELIESLILRYPESTGIRHPRQRLKSFVSATSKRFKITCPFTISG
jgi:hypothetical protein